MGKFKIPVYSSTVKSIRFPDEIVDKVEGAIKDKNCSFNAFVIEAVKVALDDLGIK